MLMTFYLWFYDLMYPDSGLYTGNSFYTFLFHFHGANYSYKMKAKWCGWDRKVNYDSLQ